MSFGFINKKVNFNCLCKNGIPVLLKSNTIELCLLYGNERERGISDREREREGERGRKTEREGDR